MKVLWMVLLAFLAGNVQAQDLIERNASINTKSTPLQKRLENQLFSFDEYQKKKNDYNQIYLKLDRKILKSLDFEKTDQLSIPTSPNNNILLDLKPIDIYTSEATIRDVDNNVIDVERGHMYHGNVRGEDQALAAIAMYSDDLSVIISDPQGNYNLAKEENSDKYVLFNDRKLGPQPFVCQSDDLKKSLPNKVEKIKKRSDYKVSECLKIYIEADYATYLNFDSDPQKVLTFIEGSFVEVAQLYAQIGVTLKISDIKIWTSQDSYGASSDVSDALNKIATDVRNFNGDMMHLISATGNCCGWSGVAYVNYNSATGKFNGSTVCGANPYGVSQTALYYESLPTYSWTVNVLAHEIGHNLGAPHTHECIWGSGYDQSLDACAPSGSNCGDPGIPATGTIMSYCHTRAGVGISLGNGFHPQVAQHIEAEFLNRSCLSPCVPVSGCTDALSHEYNPVATIDDGSCSTYCTDGLLNGDETDIDCGGTHCDPCPIVCDGSLYELELIFDRYGEELTWDLQDENGHILHQGGDYSGRPEGSVENIPLCLQDGQYTLTLYDAYGDGICCQYGSGSYALYDQDGIIVMEGAEYDREESTIFIVSSTSCTDGLMNGDETDIDCGGSCEPCAIPLCHDIDRIVDSLIVDFESGTVGWIQNEEDDLEFTLMTGNTPSSLTGPNQAAEGEHYIYLESSSPNYPAKVAQISSGCIDIRDITTPFLSFDYHMYGAGMGSLGLIIEDIELSNHDTILWISGNQENAWRSTSIDLTAYNTRIINIHLMAKTGVHYTSDIAIDNLEIKQQIQATCYDRIKNGDEENIDCGGSCTPCLPCQMSDFTLTENLNFINLPEHIVVKNKIKSSGNIEISNGDSISWQAGQSIELGVGFEVDKGASLSLIAAPCIDGE